MTKQAILVICLLVSVTAYANPTKEQADLRRIQAVLAQLTPLVNAAAKNQAKQARVQFCYPCLRYDLAKIQAGIAQALGTIQLQPRTPTPLQGDYVAGFPTPPLGSAHDQ